MTALIVFAHGSSVQAANDSVHQVAAQLREKLGAAGPVIAAFLEQATPDLEEGVGLAVKAGAERVLVLPYFLTLGIHLQRDLPRIVERLSAIYPNVGITVTPPLDGHPGLLEALVTRAQGALDVHPDIPGPAA